MKLSELLTKPLKLKSGGFLNLKGFSKRVVDKEVGDNDGGNSDKSSNSFLSFKKITDVDKINELHNIIAPVIYGLSMYDTSFEVYNFNNFGVYAFKCEVDNPFKNFTLTFNGIIDIGILYKYCGHASSKEWYVPQAIFDNTNNVFYSIPGDKFNYFDIEMVSNPLIPILYTELSA